MAPSGGAVVQALEHGFDPVGAVERVDGGGGGIDRRLISFPAGLAAAYVGGGSMEDADDTVACVQAAIIRRGGAR